MFLLSFSTHPCYCPLDAFVVREGVQHDVRRFVALPSYPRRLSITHNHHTGDTAAGAWRKRWKHWGGWGASELRTASSEMDIPFVRCAEEVSYQR